MLDGRIYRAAFVPLLFVLVIAAFSLEGLPVGLASTLAPDAFNGPRAFSELEELAKDFPDRQPGSVKDNELAARIAQQLGGLGASAGGGFQVSTRRVSSATIDGERTLTTVIAERPGSTGLSPIVIVAHRDSAVADSTAELSGTAILLELARVFSQSETRRTIVLISTSGGSGGFGGAADFAQHDTQPIDAAIVLGDLAGSLTRRPIVLPFSSQAAPATENLERTLDGAISQEVGIDPGTLGVGAQLAHFAMPLATGEEAPLNAAGVPAVLVQVSGEGGPSPREQVSATRLLNFGRAALSATYALDEGPNITQDSTKQLILGRKALPWWAIRLFVLALLLPPLLAGVDALARLRRRREPVLRWLGWTLFCGLPLLVCALFAILLGALGVLAAPAGQLSAEALAADGAAGGATIAVGLVLLLALCLWPVLARRGATRLQIGRAHV